MPAYLIAEIDVTDPDRFERYRERVAPTLARYAGRYRVRGGAVRVLEGSWDARRLVVIEFPSVERAEAWWSSDEYAEIKALREGSARSRILLADGVD